MEVSGTVTIKGETFEVKNTTAWLDRQGGNGQDGINSVSPTEAGQYHLSWLWLGLPLGEKHDEAISLWDNCQADGRYCFATVMKKDGSHVCTPANVTYDEIWTSSRSGNSYPKKVHVSLPSQKLNYHRLKAGGLFRSEARTLRLKVALGAKAPSLPD